MCSEGDGGKQIGKIGSGVRVPGGSWWRAVPSSMQYRATEAGLQVVPTVFQKLPENGVVPSFPGSKVRPSSADESSVRATVGSMEWPGVT